MIRPLAALAILVLAAGNVVASTTTQVAHSVALPIGTALSTDARPAVSADGTVGFLAPALGDLVVAFSVVTGDVLGTVPGHGGASGISVCDTSSHRLLAVTAPNDPVNRIPATVTVVDATAPAAMRVLSVFELPAGAVIDRTARAELFRDGRFGVVAVAAPTPALVSFDVATGEQAGGFGLQGPLGSFTLVEGDRAVRLLGVSPGIATNAVVVFELGPYGDVLPLSEFHLPGGHLLSRNNTAVARADARLGFVAAATGSLFAFDLVTGALAAQVPIPATLGAVSLYQAANRDLLAVMTLSPENANERSMPGAWVVEASNDGTLRELREIVMETGEAPLPAQAPEFAADGRTLVVPSRTALYFVDIETGSTRRSALPRTGGAAAAAPLAGSVAVVTTGPGSDGVEIVPIAGGDTDATATPVRQPVTQAPPAPLRADRLAPASVERGIGRILHVTIVGSGFAEGAVVIAGGTAYPAEVGAGGTRAVAALPPGAVASGARVAIEVRNPDGATTGPLSLILVEPKIPVVASIVATRGRSAPGAVDLTLTGQNFRSGSVVRARLSTGGEERRVDLKTYRLSYTRIVAELPAALARGARSATLEVVDRDGVTVSEQSMVELPKAKARPRGRAIRSSRRSRAWRDRRVIAERRRLAAARARHVERR